MANTKEKNKWDRPGKSRVELRLDEEVYEKIKSIADRAEISVNQLMQGLARWATENAYVGEPCIEESMGIVTVKERPGCLFFGHPAGSPDAPDDGGRVIFVLDFSDRHAVRAPSDYMERPGE